MVYSRQQQQALAQRLPEIPVALGMSYGSPSLESAVDELLAEHVDHIVVLPLYPQYSVLRSARYGMNWRAFWRVNAVFPAFRLFAIMPTTPLILML